MEIPSNSDNVTLLSKLTMVTAVSVRKNNVTFLKVSLFFAKKKEIACKLLSGMFTNLNVWQDILQTQFETKLNK